MRRLSRVAAALFVVAAAVPASLMAADQPPRVLGFERFHTAGDDQAAGGTIAAGQLLLGELNCTSCHQADASTAANLVTSLALAYARERSARAHQQN